jgi:hypothetical protein
MRRRRRPLSGEDLRSLRTWSIIMAFCWLGYAAVHISELGNQLGLSAWLSIATPILLIVLAVYCQNRLDRLGDDVDQSPRGQL